MSAVGAYGFPPSDSKEEMKSTHSAFAASLVLWSTAIFASPLLQQWRGTGVDADKIFCKYGDGQIAVVSGSQNCPLSN